MLTGNAHLPMFVQDMLTESWIPVPPEGAEEGGPAPPAFDPAAAEYTVSCKEMTGISGHILLS